jgi:hypothetical protein
MPRSATYNILTGSLQLEVYEEELHAAFRHIARIAIIVRGVGILICTRHASVLLDVSCKLCQAILRTGVYCRQSGSCFPLGLTAASVDTGQSLPTRRTTDPGIRWTYVCAFVDRSSMQTSRRPRFVSDVVCHASVDVTVLGFESHTSYVISVAYQTCL